MSAMPNVCAAKLLLWFCLLCYVSPLRAQDLLRELAQRLETEGWVDSARHEYRRWLFFAEDAESSASVWYRLGRLEERSCRYDEARSAYLRCHLMAENLDLKRWAACRAGFCSLMRHEFAEGHFHLLPAINLFDSLGRYIAWLDAICLVGMDNYADARSLVRELYLNDCSTALRLDSCLSRAEELRLLSSSRAQWLSLLPGLGLMYARAWGEGLRSVGLTGSATAWIVFAFSQQLHWLGLLSGVLVAQRFYEGGARLAASEVEQQNAKRQQQTRESILRELLRVPVAAGAAIPNAPE